MLGQSAIARISGSPANNRVFIYEVTGLRQTNQNDKNSYPFRTSGSTFIQVPYSRMNEEMRRITQMGGQIVNIRPVESSEG
ncbi:MAG: phycobilisome linker polypeptide [Microcoleaceae cyanobacterium]